MLTIELCSNLNRNKVDTTRVVIDGQVGAILFGKKRKNK